MTTYYISGPMTGLPEHNYPLFHEVEQDMKATLARKDKVINPARNFDGDRTRDRAEYMAADVTHVLEAHEIVLLPGWETSEGAKLEVAVARACGKMFRRADPMDLEGERIWAYPRIDAPSDHKDSPRASALDEARQLITGDRNNAYGPPTQDFMRTAEMASAFGFRIHDMPLQSHHVAVFLILLKASRLAWTPGKRDSWVDIAGYAGCGYECAVEEAK